MLTMDRIKQAVSPLAEKSDVDFLVLFDKNIPSIFHVMGFKEELEQSLSYPVDVVTLPLKRPDKIKISKKLYSMNPKQARKKPHHRLGGPPPLDRLA